MITPQSVRMGNIVSYDGKYCKVEFINSELCGLYVTKNVTGECKWESISGIPLTLDWAKKLGFKRHGNFYDNGNISIHKGKICVDDTRFCDMPKYVHELQNLFYAITGQELGVKINNNE